MFYGICLTQIVLSAVAYWIGALWGYHSGLLRTGILFLGVLLAALAYARISYRFLKDIWMMHRRSALARSLLSVLADADEVLIIDENQRIAYAKNLPAAVREAPFDFDRFVRNSFVGSTTAFSSCQKAIVQGTYFEDVFATRKQAEYDPESQVWVRVLPLYTTQGCPPRYRAIIFSDITLYQVAAAQRRTENSVIERYIDFAPFGFVYLDGKGRIMGVNATLRRWLGGDQYKTTGVSLSAITDVAPNRVEAVLHATTPVEVKIKPNRIDQTQALLFSTKLSDDYFIVALCRQPSSFFVHAREEPLDAMPIPSLLLDVSGEVLLVSRSFKTLFSPHYLRANPIGVGDAISSFLTADSHEALDQRMQNLKRAETSVLSDVQFTKGGPSAMAYLSQMGEGKVLLQLIDTSEQKRLEQQFVQAQKTQAVGQLAGGIAHDFNNLLTAMLGFCDLLLQRVMPNDPSYSDIMHIKQNANRASNLVRQLLAFSRRQALQPRKINVTDTLSELSALLRRLIGSQINFRVVHCRNLWPVKADVSQFEQVIINMVVNARDAITNGGDLTIETSNYTNTVPLTFGHDILSPGDYIVIKISDTGCGIPSDLVESIFEPFFSTKEVGAGTGLGLATAYGIVKQTGGAIGVESEVGVGTTFKIFLPRCTDRDAQAPRLPIEELSDVTGTETILLVEDEDAVRLFAGKALRDKGYRVFEAQNGEEALDILERGTVPDVLVTDVVMPKMDGPTLSQKVRSRFPSVQIIFTSGYAEETFRQDLTQNASIHFLPKPFTLRDLAAKVRMVLQEKRPLQQPEGA